MYVSSALPARPVVPAGSRRSVEPTHFVIPDGGKPSSATHSGRSNTIGRRNETDPRTISAMASALGGYARFAKKLAKELAEIPDFDMLRIAEATCSWRSEGPPVACWRRWSVGQELDAITACRRLVDAKA